jgi:hypothetical protein
MICVMICIVWVSGVVSKPLFNSCVLRPAGIRLNILTDRDSYRRLSVP